MELIEIDIDQLCWEMCLKNLCSQIVLANVYMKDYISNFWIILVISCSHYVCTYGLCGAC
jgi:hypothetical protein